MNKCSFSDASTKDQDLTEPPEEEHDITSPVRSFLEKSRQQVEKYWKSMVSDGDTDDKDKKRDLESVFLRTIFNNGQDVEDRGKYLSLFPKIFWGKVFNFR